MGEICILRSFEDARRRLAGMKTNIVLLWLVAVSVGLLLTYLLARRIVEPVKQLDRAAAEVARQNYAIQVEVNSQDEMGRLARTFNTMCASLRQAREDLIRQERISTIGRLSGSIVHDLRNPLAAIYGGSEMLVDADLPPAHVKRLAGNIYRASRRIQELLQDLLNVSRGKSQAPEMCRLREVAFAACDSLAAAADSQGVAIALEIPPEIELPLERNRMERAFVNLIANALEAMPEGRPGTSLGAPGERHGAGGSGRQRPRHRGGDPQSALPTLCQRRQAQRSGPGAGADAARRSSSTAATCGWNRSPAGAPGFSSASRARTPPSRWDSTSDKARRTHWRVGGRSQWLWVAESELVTVYSILPGRGSEQLKQILGADYDGWLVHDGLRCYSSLDKACHQTCLTHLIRRCKEMGERATRAAAQFPGQVKTLLQQAFVVGRPVSNARK